MTDVENNISEQKEVVNKPEKVYKTKDYVRRAINNYKKKRYAGDVEFREKQKQIVVSSQKKNPEKYREYSRIYMREYRAKKKAEKESKLQSEEKPQNTDDNIDHRLSEQLTTLAIEPTN